MALRFTASTLMAAPVRTLAAVPVRTLAAVPVRALAAASVRALVAALVATLVAATSHGVAAVAAETPVQAAAADIVASADTYVVAERPSTAYGTETKVTAANWTTWHSEAYLRFDVTVPAGASISRAAVVLTFNRLDSQPTTVELRSVSGTWNESTTYANRPAAGALVSSVGLAGGAATATFDVSSVVRNAGGFSFAVTNPTGQSVASIHSRESGSDGPRLVLEYGSTLCGASFTSESAGETYQQALARVDGYYNGLEVVRIFYSDLPQAWPGKLNVNGRPIIVSFKALPAEVLAGSHDATLLDWFQKAPSGQEIYWSYYHEPEDNIAAGTFTAAQYRQAWQRISGLASQAGNSRLHATLILMGWSLEAASGRNWRDYYPGREYLDVLGWDVYNAAWRNGQYKPIPELFAKVIAASQGEGLPYGIAETGSPIVAGDDGARRATWLREMAAHLTATGAVFASYFDLDWTNHGGPDYRLRDAASQAAWREFCS
jgi:hypothetical protein